MVEGGHLGYCQIKIMQIYHHFVVVVSFKGIEGTILPGAHGLISKLVRPEQQGTDINIIKKVYIFYVY